MMLGHFWMHISLEDGFAVTDQSDGHLAPLILPSWIFFLWAYVKDRVYHNPVHDLATLRRRIVEVVQTVDVDVLQRVWREMEYRLDIVRATRGAHLECIA